MGTTKEAADGRSFVIEDTSEGQDLVVYKPGDPNGTECSIERGDTHEVQRWSNIGHPSEDGKGTKLDEIATALPAEVVDELKSDVSIIEVPVDELPVGGVVADG